MGAILAVGHVRPGAGEQVQVFRTAVTGADCSVCAVQVAGGGVIGAGAAAGGIKKVPRPSTLP